MASIATVRPCKRLAATRRCWTHVNTARCVFVELYQRMKQEHGYTQGKITRKQLSLEGRLVPVTGHWNEDMLLRAGFDRVDCFRRWMNFAGWLALREAG